MPRDPIVEEIRAAREKIAAECDYDNHKIYQRGCDVLKRWQGKVVSEEELALYRQQRRNSAE